MPKIDKLKAEIESLPREEFAEIFRWLTEKGWKRWGKEIEADSKAGKLDFLVLHRPVDLAGLRGMPGRALRHAQIHLL